MTDLQHLILNDLNTENGEMPQLASEVKERIKTVQILEGCNLKNGMIPYKAFSGWSSLESVHIEDGAAAAANITIIRRNAFSYCELLQSVKVPNGVVAIGRGAFWSCKSLQSVNVPTGVNYIEDYTFYGCESLRSIYIPNTVTTIGRWAFCDCKSLQSVNVPTGLRIIEYGAFEGCKSLRSIYIPNTVRKIGRRAFANCDKLDQRQPNGNGTNFNYDPDINTWLRQRFNDLPIHRACYCVNANGNANGNDDTQSAVVDHLSTLVRDNDNEQTLAATDAMGMTALHVLCCNPHMTVEMVRVIVEGEQPSPSSVSLVNQIDATGSTPLELFMKCTSLMKAGEESNATNMPTINDLLERGIKYDDLAILFVLNCNQQIDLLSQDESTGFVPFMSAAASLGCELDVVFALAMNSVNMIS